MPSLQEEAAARWRSRLIRTSVISASRWAEEYRRMEGDFAGPWRFTNHPWSREMHDSQAEENVGQKAAQMAYSETMFNIAMYNLDVMKRNVLYILPNTRPDAYDFSNRIFKQAKEISPHIKSMFTGVDNVGHKIAGSANFYIRGSNSHAALKSVPASVLIFDEFDEIDQDNIKLAEERKSGQKYRKDWKVSTPTTPDKGINAIFNRSTQDHFHFPCPCCGKWIQLVFPDSLVVTADDPDDPSVLNSHLICTECRGVLDHDAKPEFLASGKWVPTHPGKMIRGFHVNQLYSCVLPPYKLAQLYLESKKDILAEQEFFNSKLGLPHEVEGAKLDQSVIENLIKDYSMVDAFNMPGQVVTMGVDVGRVLHVEVSTWDLSKCNPIDIHVNARCKVLWAGEVADLNELAKMMTTYNVNSCVIDVNPETTLVRQFANAFYGRVKLCRFNHYAAARTLLPAKEDNEVAVNRTNWLDVALGRFRNGSILIPRNVPKEYREHMTVPTRTPKRNKAGETEFVYHCPDHKADHYAFARCYNEVALAFATSPNVFKDIKQKV